MADDFKSADSLKPFDEHFEVMLPSGGLIYSFDTDRYRVYKDKIRKFYFGDNPVNERTLSEYIDLMNDVIFVYGIDQSAKAQAKRSTGRTFYYQ